jgi:hypothetical protein
MHFLLWLTVITLVHFSNVRSQNVTSTPCPLGNSPGPVINATMNIKCKQYDDNSCCRMPIYYEQQCYLRDGCGDWTECNNLKELWQCAVNCQPYFSQHYVTVDSSTGIAYVNLCGNFWQQIVAACRGVQYCPTVNGTNQQQDCFTNGFLCRSVYQNPNNETEVVASITAPYIPINKGSTVQNCYNSASVSYGYQLMVLSFIGHVAYQFWWKSSLRRT